jgi:hypothetical protein
VWRVAGYYGNFAGFDDFVKRNESVLVDHRVYKVQYDRHP